jgi:uncharacterized membrane protein
VFHKVLVLAIIGLTAAGAVLGTVIFKSHGMLAEIGGAIIGGIAGLFVGLNAISMIESMIKFILGIVGHNPNSPQKKTDKDK